MIKEMHVAVDPIPLDTNVLAPPLPQFTPLQPKLSRNDVSFPLSTPRRRAPSIASLADLSEPEGHSLGHLTIRATTGQKHAPITHVEDVEMSDSPSETDDKPFQSSMTVLDLPPEVQGRILDHIFGDMHSVNTGSTSLRGKSVSSLMRHPRRKAVSDFALVCPLWRELVQERIYRHIKIKGTCPGLQESQEYFLSNSHLTHHIRHIEFWVPVWGDKSSLVNDQSSIALQRQGGLFRARDRPDDPLDIPGITYPLAAQSATLAEIFLHISVHFPHARVFTLEGGHCKKSNMIRHFSADRIFEKKEFEILPNIRTFAMRGAWNIMRSYGDWQNIAAALPNVEEWHCGYAKPRTEAEEIINEIMIQRPGFRHVNVSLDGMYSKDPTTLGSTTGSLHPKSHLCENLGEFLPDLESLSYTGRICECMWKSAVSRVVEERIAAKLQHLEIVVKSCCRQRVTSVDPETGDVVVDELGGVMADGAGITNLTFIKAFERLILHTADSLRFFPHLDYIRMRFIDLDSPCTLLNPYWLMEKNKAFGIWSEEIVERLNEVRPEVQYEELGDGIESPSKARQQEDVEAQSPTSSVYPRLRPKSIKTSSYKVLAETRGN